MTSPENMAANEHEERVFGSPEDMEKWSSLEIAEHTRRRCVNPVALEVGLRSRPRPTGWRHTINEIVSYLPTWLRARL